MLQQSTSKTSFPIAPGRRPRKPTSPPQKDTKNTVKIMATHQSKTVADAKAKFVAGVSRGISVLMEEHGYSRERAQTALLREIARGDAIPPDDEEIFQAMSSHALGIEGAARALTVAKALERETNERNVTVMEAIDDLTSKLSVANLIRMSRGIPSAVHASPCNASPCNAIPPRPSDVVRFQPVPPITRLTSTNSNTACLESKPGSKTPKQNHDNGKHRKRFAEDLNAVSCGEHQSLNKNEGAPENSFYMRERYDSLSEVVSAKFGDRAEEASTAGRITVPPVNVGRGKRGRVDDSESSQESVVKRARGETQI